MRPMPARRLLAGLAAALLSLALLGAEEGPGAPTPAASPPPGPAGYEAIRAEALLRGETPPRLLAYRLLLRYADPRALADPDRAYRLALEAERALRFGSTAQEAGLRLRRLAALDLAGGAGSMALLLREEARRGLLLRRGFGGPERGAGGLGVGLGGPDPLGGAALGGQGDVSSGSSGGLGGSGAGAGKDPGP